MIRVFDDKLRLTGEEMAEYLKQADLERYGFTKTVEFSTETDENGKTTKKKTIYYKVADNCSRVAFWESVLEQRLPEKLQASKLSSTIVKEVQKRIAGRQTKSCVVMLEIHPNRCLADRADNRMSKRAVSKKLCFLHSICLASSIQYDD